MKHKRDGFVFVARSICEICIEWNTHTNQRLCAHCKLIFSDAENVFLRGGQIGAGPGEAGVVHLGSNSRSDQGVRPWSATGRHCAQNHRKGGKVGLALIILFIIICHTILSLSLSHLFT